MSDDIQTSAEAYEASALPKAHEVHANPATPKVDAARLPDGAKRKPAAAKSPAEWAFERMTLYIQNFEETLDSDHEIAMGFTGGEAGVMRIEGMGFFEPDIITFFGSDPNGAKTQIVQHVTQLNVLLRALPKAVKAEAPTRIGFRLAADLAEPDESDA